MSLTRGTFTRSLVGRSHELSALREWMEEAARGRGQVVVMTGEPGIGKTRLAHELAAIALASGVRVAWGRCADDPGAPPLWPWREVLRSLGLPDDGLDRAGVGEPRERFHVFDQLVVTLSRVAGEGSGVLIILDDVHWADDASLHVLGHLAARVPETRLIVLVNFRDAEQRMAAQELSGPHVDHLQLRGLTPAEVTEQLALGGNAPDRAVAAVVHDVTNGNPFFVAELAAAMAAGRWDPSHPPPRTVLDVVRRRASLLSAECRDVLGLAAVAGREVSIDLLAAASALSPVRCLALLDEAVAHGLIERTGVPERMRFVHALSCDAMRESLDEPTRVRHHRALAEALEAGEDPERHAVALAAHWAALASAEGPDHARHWTTVAAEQATRRLAYEDGARLYRSALALGGASEEERCRLLIGAARAAYMSGDLDGCVGAARQGSAVAMQLRDDGLTADAALAIEAATDPNVNSAARELCDAALASLDESAGAGQLARLIAQRSHIAFYDRDFERMRSLSEQAVALARASGEDAALIEALRARQEACPGHEGREERGRLAQEMVTVAQRAGDVRAAMWGHLWAVDTLVERGDLASAASRLEHLAAAVDAVGGPASAWLLDRCAACIAQGRGDLSAAAQAGRRAYERMAGVEPLPAYGAYLALLCGICHHAGANDEAVAMARTPFAAPALFTAMHRTGRAFLLARAGHTDAAAVEYELAGPARTWSFPPFYGLPGLVIGALTAAALGRNDDVTALLPTIERFRGQHVVGGAGVVNYLGPVELHLGALRLAIGRPDAAVDDLTAAVRATEQGNAAGFLAEVRLHLAEALLSRDGPEVSDLARTLAESASRTVRALGLDALAPAGEALRARIRVRSAKTALSPREEEVAALVGEGLTNRQIAERLVISERTAQNHVQHILTKLSFATRSQIAAWSATRR